MMALRGVRISWLIFARKSDFAEDARADEVAGLVTEQGFRAAVERRDAAVALDHDHAVGRGVQDRAELASVRLGAAERELGALEPVARLEQDQHECRLGAP